MSAAACRRAATAAAALCLAAFALLTLLQRPAERAVRTWGVPVARTAVASIDAGAAPVDVAPLDVDDPDAYVALTLRFRVDDARGWPNLFQTGPLNTGLRAEISEGALAVLLPPTGDRPLRGGTVATALSPDRWYVLRLSAVRGDFVAAGVDGFAPYVTWGDAPGFALDAPRLGVGYDPTRRFRGAIAEVELLRGRARPAALARGVVEGLKVVLLALFALALRAALAGRVPPARPPGPEPERRRYDPLMTLRFLACATVVLGHGFLINFRPTDLPAHLGGGAWLLTASPWSGVWVFFALSGYLMGKGFFGGRYVLTNASVGEFLRNRLIRIAPLYLVAVLLVAVLVHPEVLRPARLGDLALMAGFDFDGELTTNLIGPALWSISTEMQFYLCVPLLALLFGPGRPRAVALLAPAGFLLFGLAFRCVALSASWDLWPREVYKTLVGNVDLFAIGFFANALVQAGLRRGVRPRLGTAIGFALVVATLAASAYVSAQGMVLNLPAWHAALFMVWPTVVATATAAAIALFELAPAPRDGRAVRMLARTEALGSLAYAYYLWHAPIFLSLARAYPPERTWPEAAREFGYACALTLAVSVVMMQAIERPCSARRTYRTSDPAARAAFPPTG